MIAPWSPDEALAVARLRQWCNDRLQLASARTVDYQRKGWKDRRSLKYDARLVRVIDFSRALSRLEPEEQTALILTYRDRERARQVAQALGCSERKVTYILPTARRKLAAILDAMSLL